jgi:hypothetical protein
MVAILHEGKSIDKSFFQLLLDDLKLNTTPVNFYGMGTKSNFFNKEFAQYQDLSLEIERENIDKVLFIIDADESFEQTEAKLLTIIDELQIKEISHYYIACDPITRKGYLESLILSSLSEEQKTCINDFLTCSDFKSKTHDKSIFNIIYKNAYPNAPFDFSHSNFAPLKEKLINLFNESI